MKSGMEPTPALIWLPSMSAIMGALRLYLDFINLFMFLLQFMGNRE